MARIAIVGAGFGGLTAARELAGHGHQITLVDRRNHHLFQPLLYQVATAGLNPQDIAHSVRGIFRGVRDVRFRTGDVVGIDRGRGLVLTADGPPVAFDHLIVAAGATDATFGVPGVGEHAFTLKSLDGAIDLREHLLATYEAADADPTHVTAGQLTIVVVGGGPTGVELTGAFVELRDHVLAPDFPRLPVEHARVVLVEALPRLLNGFAHSSAEYARRTLEDRGVDVRLGTAIREVTEDGVVLQDGTTIAAAMVVWAAGVRAAPLSDRLGFEQDRGGRVVVDPDLRVPGAPEVHVIGDMAGARDHRGQLYPQLAPVAQQQARHVAGQLNGTIARSTPFRYRDKGIMATVGRNAAVAELPGRIRLRGFVAWLAWLGLHLLLLIGFRNRASVLLNWIHNYFTYDRAARLIVRERARRGEAGAGR